MVTAFDSNVSILQLSNPFGGAGSSPAVVVHPFTLHHMVRVDNSFFGLFVASISGLSRVWLAMLG